MKTWNCTRFLLTSAELEELSMCTGLAPYYYLSARIMDNTGEEVATDADELDGLLYLQVLELAGGRLDERLGGPVMEPVDSRTIDQVWERSHAEEVVFAAAGPS